MKKVAFVSGASRGIGAAIAEELAKNGYHLVVSGRNKDRLEKRAEELERKYAIRCLSFVGDMRENDFVRSIFQAIEAEFQTLDVVINNAGISHIALLTDMDLEEWHNVIDTNLTSVFLSCKYAVPLMLKKKSGKIINISSVWGDRGASCEVAYSASKGGMNSFTKALGKELAPSGIQVNAVAFGLIDTEMNGCFSEGEKADLAEEVPTGRFGTVEEAAQFVGHLIQAPSYLTGQVITMDGGWI